MESKKYDVLWISGIVLPLLMCIIVHYTHPLKYDWTDAIIGALCTMCFIPIALFICMSIQDRQFLNTFLNPWLELSASLCFCYLIFIGWIWIGSKISAGNDALSLLGATVALKIIETHFIMIILAFISSVMALVIKNTYVSLTTPVFILIAIISFSSNWYITLPLLILTLCASIFTFFKSRKENITDI